MAETVTRSNPFGVCECGCGTPVKSGRRFIPGHNATGRPKGPRILVACATCGTPVSSRPSEKQRYCSQRCYHAGKPSRPLAERFWAKVNKNGPIPEHWPELGPCYIWTAYTNAKGYGVIGVSGNSTALAHRVGYELQVGPIPPDKEPDHLCRNRSCVRGSHLEAVTHKENVQRGRHWRTVEGVVA